MRVEVLGGVEPRRRWSHDHKVRIIEETLISGAKVTEVARRNGIAANVVFTWRRQARTAEKVEPCFVPMEIAAAETGEQTVKVVPDADRQVRPVVPVEIDIDEAAGAKIKIRPRTADTASEPASEDHAA